LWLGVIPVLTAAPAAVIAQSAPIRYQLHISSQPIGAALKELAGETGLQIARFSEGDEPAVRANAVVGTFTATQALDLLLAGTGFQYRIVNDRTVAIVRSVPERPGPVTPPAAIPPAAVPAPHSDLGTGGSSTMAHKGVLARLAGLFMACSLAAGPNPACAQAIPSAETAGVLAEIFVTANRRAERLEDTALSISALTGTDLDQKGALGMSDYLNSIPGFNHLDLGIGRNATVVRGISLGPQDEGISSGQTVGYYFSDVPLSDLMWSPPDIKLVDMERVELLRGPQGTLYGAGALSGAIRNIPAPPNLQEYQTTVEAGYSETARSGRGNNDVQGVLNLPLIPGTLAIRAVAYNFEDSGYVTNVAHSNAAFLANAQSYGVGFLAVDQTNVGSDYYTGARVATLWKPADNLNVTLTYLTQNASQNGFPEVQLGLGLYQQTRLQMADVVGGGSEYLGNFIRLGNLLVNYDLPWASLVSSTSYSDQKFHRHYGIDFYFGGVPVPQIYETEAHGMTEELRLVSRLSGPLQFVAGLYYEHLTFADNGMDLYGGDPADNPYGPTASNLYEFSDLTHLRQRAAFGEVAYTVAKGLTLTLGARRSDYDKDTTNSSSGFFAGAASSNTVGMTESKTTYKANLAYKPNDTAMVYADFSQGFRFGKPVNPYPSTCDDGTGHVLGTDIPISGGFLKSDSLNNYELGGKFTLLDKKLTLNVAVYQIDWSNLPVTFVSECKFPVVENAGKARSRGFEAQAELALTKGLRVDFDGSMQKARLVGNNPGIGNDGDRLPGSPEYQFSLALQYSFNVAAFPAYVRGEYVRLGGFYTTILQTTPEVGGYGQLNAKVAMTFGRLEASIFGSNLTNAANLAWFDAEFLNGRADRLRPRTVGVHLKYQFR
jgi:outer membrane receptor protein involved in Fe transport